MGHPKHPLFSGSTFGLMSGEKPLFQPQVEGGHEALGGALQQMGLHAEQTSGKYKEPERSYIIHGATQDQMKQLGKLFGQESVIHSENGQHKLIYTNGEHEGKYHPSEMQNPLEHFEQPPPDFYTSIPGHGHFRINFDFSKMQHLDPINKAEREFEPELVAYLMKNAVADLLAQQKPATPHPHAYEWHDGHHTHHEQDHAAPQLPGLTKADAPGAHPHMDAPPKPHPTNEQAAGVGVSTYKQFALPYGNVTPGSKPDLLHYNYHGKLPEIQNLVQDHGFKTYYAGGKYGKPDLANKNYNTGHLMVYDPSPEAGASFGHQEYTNGWRQIHELSHALVLPELNKIYGEGRRMGKLGIHRNMNEALRAVHWEWLAAHKQRELSKQIGVPMKDEDFHKELNTVMHDAAHRAVTGKFTEPSGEGFVPHSHKVPLHTALQMVRDAGNQMGLKGLHDLIPKGAPMNKAFGYQPPADKHGEQHHCTSKNCGTFKVDRKDGKAKDGSPKCPKCGGGSAFHDWENPAHDKYSSVKKNVPGLASPKAAGVTAAPAKSALHNDLGAFHAALKAHPAGSPGHTKLLAAHANHAPLLQDLTRYGASGSKIISAMNRAANSVTNAGPQAGAHVTMKSEVPTAIFSKTEGDTTVADEKLYTPEEAREILLKATKEKVDAYAKEIEALRSRELKKSLIPNHKHNQASQASSGVEDVPPGKINPKGIDKAMKKEELCKQCGKGHELDKCGDMMAGKDPAKKAEDMDKAVDKIIVHGDKKPAPAPAGADYTVKPGKDKTVIETKKSDLVDAKGKRSDNHTVATSKLPDDAKPKLVNKDGGSGGGIKLPGSNLKKSASGSVGGAGTPPIPKPKEPKKRTSVVAVSSLNITPGLQKAATPPMAKPPSGANMGTAVPTSAPKAPKAPMAKGMLADAAKQADPISAAHAAVKAPAPAAPKMPSPAEHAQRAAGFQAAAGGAFQPKPAAPAAAGPKLPGAALGLKSPKAAGVTRSAGPVMNAARPAPAAKPGIFGKLFGKGEVKADAKCEKCGDAHKTGDHAMAVLSEPMPKVLHPSDKKSKK